MKLYSIITSERATKGQGGNEYLLIDILNEKQEKVIQLHVTQAKDHLRGEHQNIYIYNPHAEYISISQNDFIDVETKSKKQTGEIKCASGHIQDADGRCPCVNTDAY